MKKHFSYPSMMVADTYLWFYLQSYLIYHHRADSLLIIIVIIIIFSAGGRGWCLPPLKAIWVGKFRLPPPPPPPPPRVRTCSGCAPDICYWLKQLRRPEHACFIVAMWKPQLSESVYMTTFIYWRRNPLPTRKFHHILIHCEMWLAAAIYFS